MSYMTRYEFLSVLVSIRALIETHNTKKALEILDELISEAKKTKNSDQ